MEAKSILNYYSFGTCVRFLQDCSEGTPIYGKTYVITNIGHLIGFLDEQNLQVTRRAARSLIGLKDKLSEEEENATLSAEQAKKLSASIRSLRKTLEAELEGFEVYFITPKRMEIDKLLNNVKDLFAPDTFRFLPDIAQFDFIQSARCIAFDMPTAAAFHTLRGTEAVLKYYYCDQIRQKRVSLMWGNIVADLRKRSKTKPRSTLNSNLDNIRLSFRNPTQHPEKIYDIQEAQDLWSLCIDVINRMIYITEGLK